MYEHGDSGRLNHVDSFSLLPEATRGFLKLVKQVMLNRTKTDT